ncbi:MAG: dimethylargininase [Microbacteriaceae bacterium]
MTSRSTSPLSLARLFVASLLTALAVALVVHLATLFAYAVAGSFTAESISQSHTYFLPTSLILFVVVFVFTLVGAYRYWYATALAGIAAAIIAPLAGTMVNAALVASPVTADQIGALFASLSTLNLAFAVATVITVIALGPRVWRVIVAAPSTFEGRGQNRRIALVRPPAPILADGLITHIERSSIDTERADQQWDAYVAALTENGWTAVDVDAADDHADSVFVEDTVVMFGNTAVLTNPGAESRVGEIAGTEAALSDLNVTIERIVAPGTLEGGDVLKVGTTVYVGRGGRTNAEGIRQLRAIATPLGYTVVAVPVTKALHLKTAVTALPDGTVIGYPPLVDDPTLFDRYLAIPEAHGTAVVVLAPDAVLMSSAAPRTAALIEQLGYRVVTVDISEFEKLEGCVTCLSVRVR